MLARRRYQDNAVTAQVERRGPGRRDAAGDELQRGGTIRGGGGGGGGGDRGPFVFGRGADSVSLDPVGTTDGESLRVTRQIFDGLLLGFAPETYRRRYPRSRPRSPNPRLTKPVLHLQAQRTGVTFHDGAVPTPGTVKFNFDRWRGSKDTATQAAEARARTSPTTWASSEADDDSIITGVDVVDNYTVRIKPRRAQGPFLKGVAMTQFGMASPKAIKGNVEGGFWQSPVGTGPFKFVEWNRGSTVRARGQR